MAKLELALLVGEQSKGFLASLTKQIDRLEALTVGGAVKTKAVDAEDDDTEASDDAEEFAAPKKALKKAAAKSSFEDEEESEDEEEKKPAKQAEDDEDEEESFEKPAPKAAKKKAKKVTREDVNAALKAHAKTGTFAKTKATLKKKFKVDSIDELDEDQWPAVITAFQVEEE